MLMNGVTKSDRKILDSWKWFYFLFEIIDHVIRKKMAKKKQLTDIWSSIGWTDIAHLL